MTDTMTDAKQISNIVSQISNMVRVLGMYIKWDEENNVEFFCEKNKIDFENLKEDIDFAMYDRAKFLGLLIKRKQDDMVDHVQTICNILLEQLNEFIYNLNTVYNLNMFYTNNIVYKLISL